MVRGDGMEARLHHPVVDRWSDYTILEAWVPVEVTGPVAGQQWVGALHVRVNTEVRLEDHVVVLSNPEVFEINFSDEQTPAQVIEFARDSLRQQQQEVTLDEVILSLAEDFEPPRDASSSGFNRNPPRIVVSETPARLMLIDQRPVRAPITGTSLEQVVNTDWNLFYDTQGRSWYVINEGVWQTESLLASGNWPTTDRLPEDFLRLPNGQRWQAVREALPPRTGGTKPPALIVSLEPTELVLIDGAPRLQAIPGADGLMEVANSASDLFQLDGRWYFLAAGRWFSSTSLKDGWAPVDELPGAFAKIPQDHGRAAVRASVPGTMEAALAFIAATLPQEKTVPAGSAPAQDVVYVGAPRFEPIAGTAVERAVNTPFAVIRHNNAYYLNYEAAWYRSDSPSGPWQATPVVPDAIYGIPPNDPLYYVTFVRPAGNQPLADEARFTYTEGYNGMYTIGSTAVRGTGWAYQPWISYPGGSPVYWGYPPTFGLGYPGARPGVIPIVILTTTGAAMRRCNRSPSMGHPANLAGLSPSPSRTRVWHARGMTTRRCRNSDWMRVVRPATWRTTCSRIRKGRSTVMGMMAGPGMRVANGAPWRSWSGSTVSAPVRSSEARKSSSGRPTSRTRKILKEWSVTLTGGPKATTAI